MDRKKTEGEALAVIIDNKSPTSDFEQKERARVISRQTVTGFKCDNKNWKEFSLPF